VNSEQFRGEQIMKVRTSWFSRHRVAWVAAVTAIAGAAFIGGLAVAAQPHMDNALGALQTAKSELQVAEANKGGHRVAAIRLVDQAIAEVRAGIRAGM
jgi:hypothetical protein